MSGLGFQAPAIASQMYQTFSTKSEWREISDNGLEIQAITQRQDDLRKNSDMNDPDVQQAILEMEFRKEDLIKRLAFFALLLANFLIPAISFLSFSDCTILSKSALAIS